MTVPTLVANYQEKSFNTAATVFERKLGEALKTMNTQQSLAGHSSTESFVEELSRHIKINKICSNNKLMECFENEVFWGSDDTTPKAVDMTVVKLAKHFGQKEWQQTNVVGIQFASGVSALIAYNKDAAQDPYSNQIVNISGSTNGKSGSVSLGTTAIAILYDTNGAKSPNQSAKDIRSINVTKLGRGCFAEINGVCLARIPFTSTPVTKAECEAMKSTHGITACNYDTDYWAGAVKACGGRNKMASMTDLGKIAAYVFNQNNITAKQNIDNGTFDTTKAAELGLPSPIFYLWSSDEYSDVRAYGRYFKSTGTGWDSSYRRNSSIRLTVCLDD